MYRIFPGNGHHADSEICFVCDMKIDEQRIIHFVNMIAGQDQNPLRYIRFDKIYVLAYGICCAFVPVIIFLSSSWWQDFRSSCSSDKIPRRTGANMVHERKRVILSQNSHCVQTGIHRIAQRKIDDSINTAEWYRRFGTLMPQNTQTAASTTGQ